MVLLSVVSLLAFITSLQTLKILVVILKFIAFKQRGYYVFREYFLKHGSKNYNVSFTYALESWIFVQGFDVNKNETGC